MRLSQILLFVGMISILGTGCVTQKKKDEKVTKLGKTIHDITSKYNAYYNANILLEGVFENIEQGTRDNYTKQLDIFKYVTTPDTSAISGDVESIIEKNTVAITLHRPSHWTDDNYLMIGKGQFLKKDYENAQNTFEYLIEEFDPAYLEKLEMEEDAKASKYKSKKKKKKRRPSSKKKKKKPTPKKKTVEPKEKEVMVDADEKIKPDAYLFKHRPAMQEGKIWLAKTYLEREKYGDAERLLYELYRDPKTFKDVKAETVATLAYYELEKREAPQEAIKYLNEAVELSKKKADRSRYSFILAQIYEAAGNDDPARELYQKVIKSNAKYEMVFNAKLNLILNSHKNQVVSDDATISSLRRMTRDFKNVDYQDQIFYAMGQIALNSGDRAKGIEYLRTAIAENAGNNVQRAEAYLQLANLYFEDQDFVYAKNYFDSTLVDMPITDERYDGVKNYAENLSAIAKNIEIIAFQDSMLMIAALSPEDKTKLASSILKERRKQEILANLASLDNNAAIAGNRGANVGASNNSSFFAYDVKQVKKGLRDFKRTWGDRQLEDNWRRSTKLSFNVGDEEIIDESGAIVEQELSEDELNTVLSDVPSTPEQISMAKKETYYYLYLCHNSLNHSAEAKNYYDLITKNYPESTYAQILTDPDYAKKAIEKENQLRLHYDKAYALFEAGKIKEGCAMVDEATLLFGAENTLSAKYALLGALCKGKQDGKPAYVKALKEVVAQYPDTEEKLKAEEMLRVLLGGRFDNGRVRADAPDRGLNKSKVFKVEADKLHYCIVIFRDQNMTLDEAKLKIAEFNKFHFKDLRLRISNLFLDPESKTPLIVIRRFTTQAKAMEYYDSTIDKSSSFLGKRVDFDLYPVTRGEIVVPMAPLREARLGSARGRWNTSIVLLFLGHLLLLQSICPSDRFCSLCSLNDHAFRENGLGSR